MKKLYIVMPVINCLELTKAAVNSIRSALDVTTILIDNGSDDGTQEWGQQMQGEMLDSGRYHFKYIRNDERKSVAASWNQGIKIAFEDPDCQYVAVLNNDILLHPKTLDHLIAFMDKTKYLMVTGDNVQSRMSPEVMMTLELPEKFTDYDCWPIEGWRAEGPDFSCFLINRETIRVIGWFDENYEGAYCEDQDYHARLSMARKWVEKYNDQGIAAERIHAKRLSTAPYYHFSSQTLTRNPQLRNQGAISHGKNQSYYIRKFGNEHPEVMDGHGFEQPFGDATKNWRDW